MLFFFKTNGQGLNNDYNYDNTDLKFLFKKNGIDVYKFPFRSQFDTCINVIFEEYRSAKLTNRINHYERSKDLLAMLDEPFTDFFPKLNDSSDTWLRFYFKTTNTTLTITPTFGIVEGTYKFNTAGFVMHDTRAFDSIPKYVSNKQPLVVFYGIKKGSLISCPGDLPVKEIIKLYDYVVVAYLDLIGNKTK
jgi:hypothetical protein